MFFYWNLFIRINNNWNIKELQWFFIILIKNNNISIIDWSNKNYVIYIKDCKYKQINDNWKIILEWSWKNTNSFNIISLSKNTFYWNELTNTKTTYISEKTIKNLIEKNIFTLFPFLNKDSIIEREYIIENWILDFFIIDKTNKNILLLEIKKGKLLLKDFKQSIDYKNFFENSFKWYSIETFLIWEKTNLSNYMKNYIKEVIPKFFKYNLINNTIEFLNY